MNYFEDIRQTYGDSAVDMYHQLSGPVVALYGTHYLSTVLETTVNRPTHRGEVKTAARLSVGDTVLVTRFRRVHSTEYREASEDPREWSCHWRVRKHTRTYHRGTDREFTVEIRPYLKGDKTKPFRSHSETVAVVTR